MRKVSLAVLALVAGAAGAAADLRVPELHDVTGVAWDDVLNIRTAPTARAEIIGGLAPDATGIEVTALDADGRWGRINTREGTEATGWVFMRYMEPRGVHIDNYNMPVGLRCYGAEPFWNLRYADGALRFASMGSDPSMHRIDIAQDASGRSDLRRMIRAEGGLTAFIHQQECSDSMSDFLFGLSVGVMPGADAPLLTGCCSLEAPPRGD